MMTIAALSRHTASQGRFTLAYRRADLGEHTPGGECLHLAFLLDDDRLVLRSAAAIHGHARTVLHHVAGSFGLKRSVVAIDGSCEPMIRTALGVLSHLRPRDVEWGAPSSELDRLLDERRDILVRWARDALAGRPAHAAPWMMPDTILTDSALKWSGSGFRQAVAALGITHVFRTPRPWAA